MSKYLIKRSIPTHLLTTRTLLIFGIYVLVSSCAVPKTLVRLEPTYHIIESDLSRDELFVNANIWLVESFKSAKDVIQFSDKEAGIVMGKYLLSLPYFDDDQLNPQGISALIKLQVKEGATRITIIPEAFVEPSGDMYYNAPYDREDVQNSINLLIQSYVGFVKFDRSNDW